MDKGSCPGCSGTVKGHAESAQWEEEQVRKAWDGGGEKIVYPPPKNGKQEYGSSKLRRMEQQTLLYGRLKLYPLKTSDPRLGDYEATGFRSREVSVSWWRLRVIGLIRNSDLTQDVPGVVSHHRKYEKVWLSEGFPGGTCGKEPTCQCRRHKRCRFDPWVRKIP